MDIKVLGSGCANCRKLEELTRQVVDEMHLDASVEKVEDIGEIVKYGALSTPGLVIDEQLVSAGRVPSKGDLTTLLVDASSGTLA